MDKQNRSDVAEKIDWSAYQDQLKKLLIKRPEITAGFALLVIAISYFSFSDSTQSTSATDSKPIEELVVLPVPGINDEIASIQTNKTEETIESPDITQENANTPMAEEEDLAQAQDLAMPEDNKSAPIAASTAVEIKGASVPDIEKASAIDSSQSIEKKEKIVAEKVAKKISEPKTPAIAKVDSKKAVESWVFNESPKQYTIQLIGSSNKKNIEKFINANQKQSKLSYFHTIKNNKNWYVVVQGSYKSFAEAEAERKQLPENLAKNNPWTRQYVSIQKEISANAEKNHVNVQLICR